MEIREIRTDEAERVSEVMREAFAAVAERLNMTEAEYPHYAGFERVEGVVNTFAHGARAFGLFHEDMMVGTVRCWMIGEDVGEVGRLAVLPAYRGRGYGEALVARAEEALREQGAARAALKLVRHFTRLEAFYAGLGYSACGDEDYDFLPFNGRKMAKTLEETE